MSRYRTHRCLQIFIYILALLALSVGLLGCKPAPPSGETAVASTPPEATPVSPPTPTDAPTPTPTAPPARALLAAPPGADAAQVEALRALLSGLAAQDGLEFELREQIGTADLEADVRLAVVLAPDPGVQSLAQVYTATQFLAVGIPGLQAAENLSLIGSGGERPDQQGFLAGYLAAVITQDWRVGVISQADTPAGRAARQGFVNGMIFYCGLCRPAYPPFLQYPVTVDLPAGASQEEQQAAADILIGSAVQTVYIAPGVGGQPLLEYLAQAGVKLIGGSSPPESVRDRWAATIRVDLSAAIQQAWPRLLSGEGGINLETPLALSEQNEVLFSPGRQRLVEKLLAELVSGYIDSGVDPQTGEPR
ncbi:MAG: hypothetical protein JXA78_07800 [Anaerolineales bacterium]|nr:hypothetical protein [Anaerolineales bacterium]